MPITELVLPQLKPETAQEALKTLRTNNPLASAPGVLSFQVGHIHRQDHKDVVDEYRPMLALEWESPENFHALYPNSELFAKFFESVKQYAAGPAAPRLFAPRGSTERSVGVLQAPSTHLLIGSVGDASKEAVEATFDDMQKGIGGALKDWHGWGIEGAEGTFVAMVGGESEEIHNVFEREDVRGAYTKLKEIGAFEVYVVNF